MVPALSSRATTLPSQAKPGSRWRRIAAPTLLATCVLGASILLHVRDPHQNGSWGFCPWLVLTGTYCPGCGGLRAVNDLTHGQVAAAASSNLLFVGSVPLAVFLWGRWLTDRWNGVRRHVSSRRVLSYGVAFLAAAVVFAIARNTTPGAWLAP